VKVKSKEEEFLRALTENGLQVSTDRTYIEVEIVPEIERTLFRIAYELGAEIRYVVSRASTLEDVFVDLFESKEELIT
jgi:hypothetical protein